MAAKAIKIATTLLLIIMVVQFEFAATSDHQISQHCEYVCNEQRGDSKGGLDLDCYFPCAEQCGYYDTTFAFTLGSRKLGKGSYEGVQSH
ncbi:hypothetical protein DCAR_0104012 [Daucus carota subsp. sativus]|uniref:Uncharacterized protein n=1 Tax=Daucus carota subsp. sativus TaxID=79200 RepID=A0A162B7W4_DAUCS|nr:hypothetical protein DCAR_0104012 [Daucus carota subsp. sativus]